MKTAVLVSGRGSNLQTLVKEWKSGHMPIEIIGVGSDQPDALALEYAQSEGIPVVVFPMAGYPDRASQEEDLLSWLKECRVELLLLAGYMKILSGNFIEKANIPILNIHPSLLPAFPGMHAQRQALEYGVKYSGCTVHFVDKGLDSGPIILQGAVPVLDDDTEDSLSQRILKEEHRIYPLAVNLVASNKLAIKGHRVFIKQ
ncbi:MAG: phosphoribosylglycinamide formyltransferase [Desulfitobacteriaceae bacterium]|nr:phosphoribosylglycinamide formyltransferase [Desulfitobacteriaceae bacterium]MDD4346212.1 phosphoribosylglycinamide formyltransferase [Desulfitobacteriaceae bacterium]MDD4400852.1 phosphoribosylglycinamide formyltransferase [Desulfitobacteriaceae bacterium]